MKKPSHSRTHHVLRAGACPKPVFGVSPSSPYGRPRIQTGPSSAVGPYALAGLMLKRFYGALLLGLLLVCFVIERHKTLRGSVGLERRVDVFAAASDDP